MYTFAERLRGFRTREDRKLTQQALADKLGASRRTISDWERGLYLPKTREMALDLAEALGLSPTDTNLLLVAAQYPPEPVAAGVEGGATRFEEARVGLLVVDRLETGPPAPPGPIPTRVPESKARKLIGREDEIAWVCDQLRSQDVAAVVGVRGVGGIGKTEVAIAAVEALCSHFAGQVIWLEGGPNDVFALQGRLSEALGVRLEAGELATRADALHLALRNGPPRLIVLDDLRRRHLADFVHLKPPCPPCALLVTSRRADLPLPDDAILRLDQLTQREAEALLAELLPNGWPAREPGLVAEIAGFLERIPLALTLAERRARQIGQRQDGGASTPLATLLAELRERRLQVLNQGEDPLRSDLSVVITFNASYEDLEPADQARLRELGVFARNEFELGAVQAVWQEDEPTTRQIALRLVNAGLISEADVDKWRTHDLFHDYTMQLAILEHEARARHAEYFVRSTLTDSLELRAELLQAASYANSQIQSILHQIPLELRYVVELNLKATALLIEWTRGDFQ